MSAFKLNGVAIVPPSGFRILPIQVSRKGRVSSGKMVQDFTANKRIFTLRYDTITWTDLEIFADAFTAGQFIELTFPVMGAATTATVWFEHFPRQILLYADGVDLWEDVTITLEEQ